MSNPGPASASPSPPALSRGFFAITLLAALVGTATLVQIAVNAGAQKEAFGAAVEASKTQTLSDLDRGTDAWVAQAIHAKIQPCLQLQARAVSTDSVRSLILGGPVDQSTRMGQQSYRNCMAFELAYLDASGNNTAVNAIARASGVAALVLGK